MRSIFIAILTLYLGLLKAQTARTDNISEGSKVEFKNQNETEDSAEVQFFNRWYSEQKFPRYKGIIVISGDTARYADKYILIPTSKEFRNIFSGGIFYPEIIGSGKSELRLAIYNFRELKALNDLPSRKRYWFWLYENGLLNPIVCFIELTNQNATDKTDIETFINGASLTFFKEGWIII